MKRGNLRGHKPRQAAGRAASARLRFGERLGDAEMIAAARAYMARERVVDATALSSVAVPV